jgi:hypothetical protein
MEEDKRKTLAADLVPELPAGDVDEFSLEWSSQEEESDQEAAHARV